MVIFLGWVWIFPGSTFLKYKLPFSLNTFVRLGLYVQFSLLEEDSKLIYMKHGKVNLIYLLKSDYQLHCAVWKMGAWDIQGPPL